MDSWADPSLQAASDAVLARRLRLHQSWYRAEVLGKEPGFGGPSGARLVGNMLRSDDVTHDPSLNFFGDDSIVDYVRRRVVEHKVDGRGIIETHRLTHNLLSSQPMAFSLAAKLGGAGDRAQVLSAILGLDIAEVSLVEAEWGPPKGEHLNDNTACDLAVVGTLSSAESVIVGVETKYSEPLERKVASNSERYSAAMANSGWCGPEFADTMATRGLNQICRDMLLVASLEAADVTDRGLAVVITMEQDAATRAAIEQVRAAMLAPDRLLWVSWQRVIEVLKGSSLAEFGEAFEQRYVPAEWR